MSDWTTTKVRESSFVHTQRYSGLSHVGMGAQGHVCRAFDEQTKKVVAIKKLAQAFHNDEVAKRTYREVKLLKSLSHDNLVKTVDMFLSPGDEDIYIVFEYVQNTLSSVIQGLGPLGDNVAQHLFFQLLNGLNFLHNAGVIHRDLKPTNILVEANWCLRICDLGLAREEKHQMTGFVVARYYRAPEVMLNWQHYDRAIDIWSAGCILAEMRMGRPLFVGTSEIGQFQKIAEIMGKPSEVVVASILDKDTQGFVRGLPEMPRQPLERLIPGASIELIDLLNSTFEYERKARITAHQALRHAYLKGYQSHLHETQPVHFDWTLFQSAKNADAWKGLVLSELFLN